MTSGHGHLEFREWWGSKWPRVAIAAIIVVVALLVFSIWWGQRDTGPKLVFPLPVSTATPVVTATSMAVVATATPL
ncbi:MAG: hypothetical protein Q8O97_02230, partial [bacterium]|nr:hypothetical protein [bacterium]